MSDGTKITLYADDTKIWREIETENDCFILNQDIAALHQWAEENCMKFHPDKCKVLTITLRHQRFNILPFDRFSYELGSCILDYVNEEKDLGVIVTNKLNWDIQQATIITIANKQLVLLMRTCHFVKNYNQKRSLYMALIRSLFEHCGEIWAPNTITADQNFEPIQIKAIKWILNERHKKYSKTEYIKKLYKL